MLELHNLTARELRARMDAGEVSSREVTEHVLERIETVDETIGAYLAVTAEQALAAAEKVDAARARGDELPPLAGIPVSVKDNIVTKDVPTTAASRLLENWKPPYDATTVRTLKNIGAPIVGKTNLDEFAMGNSTRTSAFRRTHNPWDLRLAPGGSSGGAAASVAAGMAVWGLGSDTGGSIRQPAAFCGVVGMKPTYGLVSRFGLIGLASSLDQIGAFTLDVADMALALNVLGGKDVLDSTSVGMEGAGVTDFTAALKDDVKGLRIGVPKEYFGEGIDAEVRAAVEKAIEAMEAAGAIIKEVSLPTTEYALTTYHVIVAAEGSSGLARFDGVRYGLRVPAADVPTMMTETRAALGHEVKRRVILGTYLRGHEQYKHYFEQAAKVRTVVRNEFDAAFAEVDVLMTPSVPTTAFPLERTVEDPVTDYMSDVCTFPVNLAGLPALSMPCGVDAGGMPIGLQIIGPAFGDAKVLHAAYAYEQLASPRGAGRQWREDKEVAAHGR